MTEGLCAAVDEEPETASSAAQEPTRAAWYFNQAERSITGRPAIDIELSR